MQRSATLLPKQNYLPKNKRKKQRRAKAAAKLQVQKDQDPFTHQAKAVFTTEISYMLGKEEVVITTQEAVNNM